MALSTDWPRISHGLGRDKVKRLFGFIGMLVLSSFVLASEVDDVSKLLAQKPVPEGIIFEMVGGDADSLNDALKRTESYMIKLRKIFPKAKFVIITHGLEQFSLLKHLEEENPELHKRVGRIAKNGKVPIQVCGAFAEMSDIDTNEFIDTVQVVDSGPLQIQEYVEQGYVVIEMELH